MGKQVNSPLRNTDDEDAVIRCKDRRHHTKEAIYAHHQVHHLAVAHSDYIHSLLVTSSALSAFAGDGINEFFDKAASTGEQVSEMLETVVYGQPRTVYHTSGVFSNLSLRWTSKPPLAVKYRFEPGLIHEQGGTKSLCSTLVPRLAWEKKLYEEVKVIVGETSLLTSTTNAIPVF
ncbi:hypothetical protein Vadar_021561 [Vaccinium darrowii]|uniref:Uncharacterized protein n=1 Tax=Vaccinium darrowii TaxID=229202 RepID=A0ACB7Y829_9ERIC|nr:hypothetical protein Vadar_021561 [Vaccinium darrowii]